MGQSAGAGTGAGRRGIKDAKFAASVRALRARADAGVFSIRRI